MNNNSHIARATVMVSDTLDKGLIIEIGETAAVSAIMAGINGMVKEGQENMERLHKGEIDNKELTVRVIRTGAKTAATGGAKAALALSVKEGIRAISKRMGWRGLWRISIRHSHAFTAVAFGLVDQSWSTVRWVRGDMSDKDFGIDTFQNVGSTSGAIGGAATGAALGSVIPGVGTTVGALLGAYLGSQGGGHGGRTIGIQVFEEGKDVES